MIHDELEMPPIPALREAGSVQMMLNMYAASYANPVSGDATTMAPPFIEPPC